MQKNGDEFISQFAEDKKRQFEELLVASADKLINKSTPIKDFSICSDTYSFELSNGLHASQIKFKNPSSTGNYYVDPDNLISTDLKIVLVPRYSETGPKWYVVYYGDLADFDFLSGSTIDWVKLYREKFGSTTEVSKKELETFFKEELKRQWNESKYARLIDRNDYLRNDQICVNELVDAYDRGFVSPSVANKEKENDSLEKYRKAKEDEMHKSLCIAALNACEFDNKGKPIAKKLKKFGYDGKKCYFKTNQNVEKSDLEFDTKFSDKSDFVYLSNDHSVALVSRVRYTEEVTTPNKHLPAKIANLLPKSVELKVSNDLFLLELEGDSIKSINYIPSKEASKLIFPSSVKNNY